MTNATKTKTRIVVMEANVKDHHAGFGMYQLDEASNMNDYCGLNPDESWSIRQFIDYMLDCHCCRYERYEEIENNIHDGSAAYKIIRTDMEDIQEGISCLWEAAIEIDEDETNSFRLK